MDFNIIQGKSTLTNVSDAYSGTLNVSYSQYTNNGVYLCKIDTTNTTISPTLSLNGLTAYPIKRNDGTSILVGELKVDAWYLFMFDQSTSTFEILNLSIPYLNGTTNYVAKYTPTGNVLGISQIFDDGSNVGIGTATPSSKLDIDLGGTSGSDIAIQTRGSIPFTTGARTTFSVNNNGRLTAGDVGTPPSTLGHTLAAPYGSTNAFNVQSGGLSQGLFFINTDGSFSLGNGVIGGGYFDSNGTNTFRFYGANSGQSQKVGINGGVPTASLHVVGSDSSSSNYALKVQNSGGTNSLVVRNDNQVMVNADNTPDNIRFYTKANGSTDYPLYVANSGNLNILAVRGNGKITANGGSDYDVGFQIGNQFNETMPFRVKNYNNQALFAVYENGFTSTNGRANFGSNAISLPNAIVQIVGSDSTSSNYSLKVDNSSSSPLFYVRNDGYLSIGYNSVSNASLYIQGKALATGTDAIRVNSLALGTIFAVEDYLPRVNIQASYTTRPSTLTLGNNAGTQGYIGFNNNAELGWIYSSSNNGIRLEFNNKSTLNTDIYLHSDPAILTYGNSYVSASFRYNTQIGFNDVLTDYFTRLYVKGVDSTSSYYSLKIDNLANNPLFYVRNDGLILANNLPTSASGLPSGAIWNNGGILNII